MVTLNRSLVLRGVVTLSGLAVVGSRRNAGRAMPADPTPDHPLAGYRTPAPAGRPCPTQAASAPEEGEMLWWMDVSA